MKKNKLFIPINLSFFDETWQSDPRYGGLLHPEFVAGVIEATMRDSVVLSKFRKLRNMQSREMWFDVRSELPTAGAVDPIDEPTPGTLPTRTYMKPSTTQKFEPRIIKAGEFAAWKVFRDADLADALANGYDVLRNDIPLFSSQFGAAIDRAVIWGRQKPIEWSDVDSLWTRANASGAVIDNTANAYVDVFGEGGVMERIELSGYEPNGIVSALQMRARLQGMVDQDRRPVFAVGQSMQEVTPFALGGFPLWFARNGMWDATQALMLMADFNSLVYSIRQDLTYRITKDGDFTDSYGVTHKLAQQNKTVLILHMRMGWQVLDPVTQMSETPVPFAFLVPTAEDNS